MALKCKLGAPFSCMVILFDDGDCSLTIDTKFIFLDVLSSRFLRQLSKLMPYLHTNSTSKRASRSIIWVYWMPRTLKFAMPVHLKPHLPAQQTAETLHKLDNRVTPL